MENRYAIRNGAGKEISLEEFHEEMRQKNREIREKNIEFNLSSPDGAKFYVISIEESSLEKPRYWRAHAQGYTYDITEAGIYSHRDLAGVNLAEDIIVPVGAVKYLKYLVEA